MKIRRSECPLFLAVALCIFGLWLRPATTQLLGPEFQVNSYTTNRQTSCAVAADGSGNFVVAWDSLQDGSYPGVFGRRMIISIFQHGLEAIPPFWSATTATMCSGHCNAQSSEGCFCDSYCLVGLDCCLDACNTCGFCGP